MKYCWYASKRNFWVGTQFIISSAIHYLHVDGVDLHEVGHRVIKPLNLIAPFVNYCVTMARMMFFSTAHFVAFFDQTFT